MLSIELYQSSNAMKLNADKESMASWAAAGSAKARYPTPLVTDTRQSNGFFFRRMTDISGANRVSPTSMRKKIYPPTSSETQTWLSFIGNTKAGSTRNTDFLVNRAFAAMAAKVRDDPGWW